MSNIGVVSFLNARPLIEGLGKASGAKLHFDVPARLPALLDSGAVDAALIPLIDVIRAAGRWRVVSDACIGCDGETMTVRIFSQTPPHRIERLWVDPDSHTSVALATVLWPQLFGRRLELAAFDPGQQNVNELPSVLLIGDKVINPRRGSFAYEIDLGGAWRQHTGLPFVFAVWARPSSETESLRVEAGTCGDLDVLLSAARDRGVARAAQIAREQGPALGWPVELAERYLTRCLRYTIDERATLGANLFARLCGEAGLTSPGAELRWAEIAAVRQTSPA